VADSFIEALRAGTPLPATGTAHGHVRLAGGLLARVAYAHEGDATAAARLHTQAEAFRHLAPAGRTPRLHDVVEPRPGLPGGALIVDFIEGRAPRLPQDLGAMAEALARIHSLPLPPPGSPLPRQADPFLETLQLVEATARRFLADAVPDPSARAEVNAELRALRGLAAELAGTTQPLCVALSDTHPGNFIVTADNTAMFVDLEKVHVGSAAIDLAHATLATSTNWHPAIGAFLKRNQVEGFYDGYLARIGAEKAAALQPWLEPMRRLTWLRTTLFMARWRVETRAPRDPANPAQWSDSGLAPDMKRHVDATIDLCFTPGFIREVRSEWQGGL
jgi:aminoglycoside phosphotransferase